MRKALQAEVQLIPGSGGVFEVVTDGNLVFSKKKLGRFPEEGEVIRLVQAICGRKKD